MFLMRRDNAVVDALSEYVDALIAGRPAVPPDWQLGTLARLVRRELRREDPRPEYVDRLRMRLTAAADQRLRGDVIVELPVWRRRPFILGAAGLVSAAAVVALVARSRSQARAAA